MDRYSLIDCKGLEQLPELTAKMKLSEADLKATKNRTFKLHLSLQVANSRVSSEDTLKGHCEITFLKELQSPLKYFMISAVIVGIVEAYSKSFEFAKMEIPIDSDCGKHISSLLEISADTMINIPFAFKVPSFLPSSFSSSRVKISYFCFV